mgnify:CR=1 FL=1
MLGEAELVERSRIVMEKPFGTDLASRLMNLHADTLIITGCTTSGCVRATVVEHVLQPSVDHVAAGVLDVALSFGRSPGAGIFKRSNTVFPALAVSRRRLCQSSGGM